MIVREYELRDRDAVVGLVAQVLREFGFEAKVAGVERDLREAHDRYSVGRAGFWVAEENSEILGTVAVRPKDDRTCELKRLYVRPDRRGSGLGQRLYEHAETFARRAGYDCIWLDSSRRFTAARKLYERNGFVLVEALDNAWEDNVYEKRLR